MKVGRSEINGDEKRIIRAVFMCFYVTAVRPVADDDDDERPRVVPADCGGLYESGNFRLRLGGSVLSS